MTAARIRGPTDPTAPGATGHSRKPDEQYELIEACSEGPYAELFARGARNGWETWGYQADADYTPTWKTYPYNSAVTGG